VILALGVDKIHGHCVSALPPGHAQSISRRATSPAQQETYLAYLPSAHILEFSAEVVSK
jgi:hypothetical protein